MHIHCPHCRNPIEVIDDQELRDVICPSCGSSFNLLPDETVTRTAVEHRTLGHFELMDRIGVGAFGEVWTAHDSELDRTVAIKLPRKGQLSTEEAESFLREARSAARLNHPGIVAVHEVGKADDQLFIVSDYVRGVTLADWLTGKRPTPKEAAELMAQLADAVQHAHEHGVIHRDLKPGNIMLSDDGQPHIMDFGLAKRDAGEITMTVEGKVLGTPAYMSPEQARGEGHHADCRSDVYSLGTVLFELLTGEKPFRGTTRMLMHQLLSVDPAPGPRTLNHTVPRDLDTVTSKCLEKEPNRRYATAQEFADDLQRFLHDEPVRARPTSRTVRFVRLCRRNRVVTSLSALLVMVLLSAVVVTSMLWLNAHRHAARAEQNFQEAHRAVNRFFVAVSESPELLGGSHGTQALRTQLLSDASDYFREFLEQSERPELSRDLAITQMALARTLRDLGKMNDSRNAFLSALEVYERLLAEKPDDFDYRYGVAFAREHAGLGYSEVGDVTNARRFYEVALKEFDQLVQENPDNLACLGGLATVLGNLAGCCIKGTDPETGVMCLRRSLPIWEKLNRESPNQIGFIDDWAADLTMLGVYYYEKGQREEAVKYLQQAHDICLPVAQKYGIPNLVAMTAMAASNLVAYRIDMDDAKSRSLLAEAVQFYTLLKQYNPEAGRFHVGLGTAYMNLGKLDAELNPVMAIESLRRAVSTLEEVVAKDASHYEAWESLAESERTLSEVLMRTDRTTEASAVLKDAAERLETRLAVLDAQPEKSRQTRHQIGQLLMNQGAMLRDLNQFAQARQVYERSIALLEQLASEGDDPADDMLLLRALTGLGALLPVMSANDAADAVLKRAMEIWNNVTLDDQERKRYASDVAAALNNQGIVLRNKGCNDAAMRVYQVALEMLQKEPHSSEVQVALGGLFCNMANLLRDQQKLMEAAELYRQAAEVLSKVLHQTPDVAAGLRNYQNTLFGSIANALALAQQALATNDEPAVNFHAQQILDNTDRLLDRSDLYPSVFYAIARQCNEAGLAYHTAQNYQLPAAIFERGIRACNRLLKQVGREAETLTMLGGLHVNAAILFCETGELSLAKVHVEQGKQSLQEALKLNASHRFANLFLSNASLIEAQTQTYVILRDPSLMSGRNEDDFRRAYDELVRAEETVTKVLKQYPEHSDGANLLTSIQVARAKLCHARASELLALPEPSEENRQAAREFAGTACALAPRPNGTYLATYAQALAACGDFGVAIENITKAIECSSEPERSRLLEQRTAYERQLPAGESAEPGSTP